MSLRAAYSNTTGDYNTALGSNALYTNAMATITPQLATQLSTMQLETPNTAMGQSRCTTQQQEPKIVLLEIMRCIKIQVVIMVLLATAPLPKHYRGK